MTAGHIDAVAGNGTLSSGSGQPAARAEFPTAGAAAEDPSGDLAFADLTTSVVWVVMGRSGRFSGRAVTAGDSYPVAGGPAGKVRLDMDGGTSVAFDRSGNVLVADTSGSLIQVMAVRAGRFCGQAMTAGQVCIVAGTGKAGFSGDGGPARKARLSPSGVAVDHFGNLVTAGFGRVRVVAARADTLYGQPMAAGHIYTIAGHGGFRDSGDGGPAASAAVAAGAAAADPAGNVVITDACSSARSSAWILRAMSGSRGYESGPDGSRGVAS